MPILSYRCQECGKEFSKIFFGPEHAPRTCPVCGTHNLTEIGPTFEADEKLLTMASDIKKYYKFDAQRYLGTPDER